MAKRDQTTGPDQTAARRLCLSDFLADIRCDWGGRLPPKDRRRRSLWMCLTCKKMVKSLKEPGVCYARALAEKDREHG